MVRTGEVSLWIWMAGLTVAGIVIFTAAMQMNQGQMEMVGQQMDAQTFSQIISKARLACQAGEGTYYPVKINVGTNVKAMYSSKVDDEPPEKVSVMISNGEMSLGNYLCIKFFDDDKAYCEDIGCEVNMTYLGTPSMDENLASLVNENMDSEVNSFEIVIKKKARKLVEITSNQSIAIDVQKKLCGNGDVDSGEECDTNGYWCPKDYGKCTKRACTKECTCEVELDCGLCGGVDQVCVAGSDWMTFCGSSEQCTTSNMDFCNYENNFDYSINLRTVAMDGSGDYKCDGTDDQEQINQALAEIASLGGGTVHLKAGTYTIMKNINIKSNTLLEGEEGTVIKISPNADLVEYFFHRNAMIQYTGTPSKIGTNIMIKGFTLDGNADVFHPELFVGTVHGTDADVISNWENKGVGARGSTLGVLLRFNYVQNIVIDSMHLQNGLGDGANLDQSSGLVFINNIATDLGHDALFYMRSSGGYVMNNDVMTRTNSAFRMLGTKDVLIGNNIVHSRPSSGAFQSTGPGIQIEGASDNIEIYNNLIQNLDGSGLWMPIGEGGTIRIHNNIIYDTGKLRAGNGYSNAGITTQGFNAIIEHNTIDEGGRAGIMVNKGSTVVGTATVRNNIIVESGVDVHPSGWSGTDPGAAIWNNGGTATAQNNCFYNNIVNFLGTVTDSGGNIYQNPQFVNYDEQDYNLESSSPCVGAATDGTDIGRYGGTTTTDDICAEEDNGNSGNWVIGAECDTSRKYNDPRTLYIATDGSGDYNCDGTNDEEQINQAISEVSSNNAYDKVFLKGSATYVISKTITMKSKVVLTGDTDAKIKLVDNARWFENIPMIKGEGINDVAIRCFEIDGNRDNNKIGLIYDENGNIKEKDAPCGKYFYTMIHFRNSQNLEIDNMYLHHNWNDILKTQSCDNIIFHDNNVRQPGHDVVYAIGSSNVWTYDNYIRIYCNSGIRPDGTTNIHIYGNDIARDEGAGGYAGIEIQGDSTVWICNNNIHDTATSIADISGGAASVSYSGCQELE